MRAYRLVDADCHTLEPPHLWETWLPKRFHDRAPRLVKDEEGGDAWSFGAGRPLMHIGLVATPGMRYEDIKWTGYTYETIRRSCFEPKARLEDMDFDGIDAAFLYPSQRTMHTFMGNEDREFHLAGVRAYNDWLAREFCAVDPQRLFGLAQMPNLGVDAAIDEMKRCREQGYRGVVITTWPSGQDDLSSEDDRFFAVAQDLAMPVSIHISIQRRRNPLGQPHHPQVLHDDRVRPRLRDPGEASRRLAQFFIEDQRVERHVPLHAPPVQRAHHLRQFV